MVIYRQSCALLGLPTSRSLCVQAETKTVADGHPESTHTNTLITSRPSVPVFGSKTALSVIDGVHHFDHPAVETQSWDGVTGKASPDSLRSLIEKAGWEGIEEYKLFDRVSVLYIPLSRAKGFLMGATLVTFETRTQDDVKTYSIVYTPHGSSVATLQATVDSLNTLPHHECLAIISNFDLVHTPPFGLAQPGKENGLALLKLLNPKFWLRTHGMLYNLISPCELLLIIIRCP